MFVVSNFWAVEGRDEQLAELHAQGLKFPEIAKIMGTTKNSAIGRARRLGLPRRKIGTPVETEWTAEHTETLKRLLAEGKTPKQIGRKIGKSRGSVSGKAFRLGLLAKPERKLRRYSAMLEKPLPENVIPMVREVKPQLELLEPEAIGPAGDFPKHGCRFIAGDVRDGNWRCCGHPTKANSSWCDFHHARCLTPSSRSPQRDQDFLQKKLA